MTLVERLRLFQNEQYFEDDIKQKYKNLIKNDLRNIIIFAVWGILNFFILTSFSETAISNCFLLMSICVCIGTQFVFVINNKKVCKHFFKDFVECFSVFLIMFLLLLGIIFSILWSKLGVYIPIDKPFVFLTCLLVWFYPIFLFILNIYAAYLLCRDENVKNKTDKMIALKKVKIYNDYFKFNLKINKLDKIKYIDNLLTKMTDDKNDNLLKELALLEKMKERNLNFFVEANSELHEIFDSIIKERKENDDIQSDIEQYLEESKEMDKEFEGVFCEYQKLIQANQDFLHELNSDNDKSEFDKLIETERNLLEKWKGMTSNQDLIYSEINDEKELIVYRKKQMIVELKLKKQQLEKQIKDILVKEVA